MIAVVVARPSVRPSVHSSAAVPSIVQITPIRTAPCARSVRSDLEFLGGVINCAYIESTFICIECGQSLLHRRTPSLHIEMSKLMYMYECALELPTGNAKYVALVRGLNWTVECVRA